MSIRLDKLYKGGIMDKSPTVKMCKGCELVKPLKDFKASYKNRDGRANRCRMCDKQSKASRPAVDATQFFVHDKYYSF